MEVKKLGECFKIRNKYFKGMSIDYLFEKNDSTHEDN